MGGSERQREIKRRRVRRAKIKQYRAKAGKASPSEKAVIANKLRSMSSGAEAIIAELELEQR